MKKPVSFKTIGFDLLWVQLTWTFWFLGIMLLINIGKLIFQADVDSFYISGYIASNIYMLIIGIIAIYFLPYYVENGISRKNYFLGNIIASIGLSIIIPILIYLLSLLESLVASSLSPAILIERVFEQVVVDIDGHPLAEVILSFILTPFVNPETNLILSLAVFSLHIYVFYLIGWLIGSAFYRLGVIGGLVFIVIGIALNAVKDSMLRLALDLPLFQSFSALDIVPVNLAIPLVFVIILITLILIRLLTKRAAIKM